MNRIRIVAVLGTLCIGILALSLGFYFMNLQTRSPSWLAVGDFAVYDQNYSWAGHNATEYMFWNVTAIRGELADVHLVSHGANISSGGVVTFPRGDVVVTVNIASREIVSLSNSSYSNEMPIGSKWSFWIPNSVGVGDAVDTFYGSSHINGSQLIDLTGRNHDSWVVPYVWPGESMTRYYDKATGICLKIQTHLSRGNLSITITETVVQTNIGSL